ncbi:MAG: HNH endonuclease [Thermodesulfobacteriota bacterium]
MKYELEEQHRNVPGEDLLADLKRVAGGRDTLTRAAYKHEGKYGADTIRRRFGSWNSALLKAGLHPGKRWRIPDEELFANLERAWIRLGRQPRRTEMDHPSSSVSKSVYEQRFGTWRKALEAFVASINQSEDIQLAVSEPIESNRKESTHKTTRQISERLKVRVLIRDGNRCRLCGVTVTGDDIHFDHIKPMSKGGETVFENIQVLCAKHNLAKGDLYEGG